MKRFAHAALFAAGFAVASAAAPVRAHAADASPSLQSFGAARAISAYELSPSGVAGFDLQPTISTLPGVDRRLAPYGAPLSINGFAGSIMLAPNLALDQGRGLDIAARFSGQGEQQPLLTAVTAPFLGLANGGRYTGVTFAPASGLRMRLGASVNSERLDRFRFDPSAPTGNLAYTYDASQTRSLLAGLSLDLSEALGLDVTGISADRSGVPLGLANASAVAPKASTRALSVAAHMNLGAGWVTTASFSEGMSKLDLRGSSAPVHEQSYGFSIAKHGLFGDDTLGLSFSRPAPSLSGNYAALTALSDLPPLVVAQAPSLTPGRSAAETDFQLGYVTNFLDGAVALQTNAQYQTNFQGQPGATSVSLLSRAKIKF